ncbi:glutamate dehydrogenase, partial [Mesorhizobium sp. M00.F.Ca.ET.186.01.1.1]
MQKTVEKESLNPYEIVQKQIDAAAGLLRLPREAVEILKRPKRVLAVHFPVKMDDGSVRVF